MKHSRAGSVIKWIGILIGVALLIGAGAFFYFRYRLTRGSEKPLEMPETLRDKYQYRTQADLSRLRAAGYARPMTSLEDGVRDYVRSYLSAPDSYR